MPIRTALWKVGQSPQELSVAILPKEQLLEDMIVAAPRLLSDELMLIGRQEDTGFGGRIDLLAVAPDASLVLIELKRDRTPRDVVAQALDYAAWVEKLRPETIATIYGRFSPGGNLREDFRTRFGVELDESSLNQTHQIIIVAGSLDDSTERIVTYLSERDVPINILCFQVFTHGGDQLLSRSWLLDPVQTQSSSAAVTPGSSEPWNGEFYASFGHGESRSWQDAVDYGFVCAGGGVWYSRTLNLLNPGDRVWVKIPGAGFVGVGRVTGHVQPAREFMVKTAVGDVPVLSVATRGTYHRDYVDDMDRCEYFVPVQWIQTASVETGFQEVGLFGNQNTVCKPTTTKWRYTVERLKIRFPRSEEADSDLRPAAVIAQG